MKYNTVFGQYFCGNKISNYGLDHGFVDYATLAKSFDAVLNNEIINKTYDIGYWEIENGSDYYYEVDGEKYTPSELEDLKEELEQIIEDSEDEEEKAEAEKRLEEAEEAEEYYNDIFQCYIISEAGAEILKDYTDEIVFYNSNLDMYVWGVTHYGTAWDYVLTDIKCNGKEE